MSSRFSSTVDAFIYLVHKTSYAQWELFKRLFCGKLFTLFLVSWCFSSVWFSLAISDCLIVSIYLPNFNTTNICCCTNKKWLMDYCQVLQIRFISIFLKVLPDLISMFTCSLKYINVAMVTVLKNVTNVITAVGEMYLFNKHHDNRVWAALFLMVCHGKHIWSQVHSHCET